MHYIIHAGTWPEDGYTHPEKWVCGEPASNVNGEDDAVARSALARPDEAHEWDKAARWLREVTNLPSDPSSSWCTYIHWAQAWESRAVCHKCYKAFETAEVQLELLRTTDI